MGFAPAAETVNTIGAATLGKMVGQHMDDIQYLRSGNAVAAPMTFAPAAEVVGVVGEMTLGYSGNGVDHLQYEVVSRGAGGEMTLDPAGEAVGRIGALTLGTGDSETSDHAGSYVYIPAVRPERTVDLN